MSEETKDYSEILKNDDIPQETALALTSETNLTATPVNLNEESLAIIEQIVAETDESKTKALTHLFNVNQNKKTMVRVNKLNDLLDTITDQALARFTQRPDEISNKELFDGLKVVQDMIERGQKQVSDEEEAPLIQVNQQTNEVNIGNASENLDRNSRERVKTAVLGLLNNLTTAPLAPIESKPIDTNTNDSIEEGDENE